MVRANLKAILVATLVVAGALLCLAALLLLAHTAQDAGEFARLQPWLLLINGLGIFVLLVLIGRKLFALFGDWRRHRPGSRMKARAVAMFAALALAPILLVYYFSIQFLNRGIDSWFNVDVNRGFADALTLSRASLGLRTGDFLSRTETAALELRGADEIEILMSLDRHRRASGAAEMLVVGASRRIVAVSGTGVADALPSVPGEDVLLQARRGRPYVSLDPGRGGGYLIITAAPISGALPGRDNYVLVGYFPVPEHLAGLADGVQLAYSQYGQLMYLRPFLKYTFTLTLTIVLLLSALAAVYGAFFWAQRLTQPVQDLIAGTRAVAKGDLTTQLPLPSRDEMGFLVHSFNDMTRRLSRARSDADRSRAAVETERANLAIILARLSTGVISLEADLKVRTVNAAAASILGLEAASVVGQTLAPTDERPLWSQFVAAVRRHIDAGQLEWREQFTLQGDSGRRELMCACTVLPGEHDSPGGVVVVFDDITTLLQAQRDAAWGEVARRLAHEIKNPLTPIQLSAERMRRKFLGSMNEKDAQVLERATHTIVQQVEAMKQMVNAFSEYARAPDMHMTAFDLNQLVTEVADLYRTVGSGVRLNLHLDTALPTLTADRGRIRQILNNLLTNAIEALEGQGGAEIDLETRRNDQVGKAVELTVTDNGPGFQRELVGQVFDPYVTSKPKGTGLGLAIVKKIVEEHGGRIEAENARPGGARVRVLLPLDEAARIALAPRDSRKTEPRRERA